MKKSILLSIAAVVILSGCGKETIREVLVTTPPTVAAAAPEANKYDLYLDALYSSSAQARSWAEADLLEFGSIVCDSFATGLTLSDIIEVFTKYSSGSYDDEFFASIIAASVTFICPEYKSYVNAQL